MSCLNIVYIFELISVSGDSVHILCEYNSITQKLCRQIATSTHAYLLKQPTKIGLGNVLVEHSRS